MLSGMDLFNGANINAIEREVEISNLLNIANNPLVMERLNEDARETILKFATAYGELAAVGLVASEDLGLKTIVAYMNGAVSYEELKKKAGQQK